VERHASDAASEGLAHRERTRATSEPQSLPQAEYEAVYARVPRLTVELVIVSSHGVLLTRRQAGPCAGLWHIPGGTVRYGEPLTDAIGRVAAQELGIDVLVEGLLGYIEYPSHLERGLDWPVGIAFKLHVAPASRARLEAGDEVVAWFTTLPDEMHEEQKDFLRSHRLVR
jgi:8-oxo-dGTP diphosphatase